MRRSEALQGVRMIKFRSVLDRYQSSDLNQIDAAALLGITERTFRRWCQRYEEGGEAGLLDRRLGHASGKRVPVDREQEVETIRQPLTCVWLCCGNDPHCAVCVDHRNASEPTSFFCILIAPLLEFATHSSQNPGPAPSSNLPRGERR